MMMMAMTTTMMTTIVMPSVLWFKMDPYLLDETLRDIVNRLDNLSTFLTYLESRLDAVERATGALPPPPQPPLGPPPGLEHAPGHVVFHLRPLTR